MACINFGKRPVGYRASAVETWQGRTKAAVKESDQPPLEGGGAQPLEAVESSLAEARRELETARAEAAFYKARLEESQRLTRSGSWSINLQGGERWWSPWLKELTGNAVDGDPPELMAGLDAFHPEDYNRMLGALWGALETGEGYEIESRMLRGEGGHVIHLLSRAEVELDSEGAPSRFYGVAIELDSIQHLEKGLRDSEKQFRAFFENATCGCAFFTRDGYFLDLNEELCRINGMTREQHLGRHVSEVLAASAREVLEVIEFVSREKEAIRNRQVRVETEEGIRHFLLTYFPFFDDKGEVSHVGAVVTEVTAEVQAQQDLVRSERRMRQLADNLPDYVSRFDRERRHIYINDTIVRELGIGPEQVLGLRHEETSLPDHLAAAWKPALEQVIQEGRGTTLEFEFPSPEGMRYFRSRLVPEFANDGSVETVLSITSDFTEIQRSKEKLEGSEQRLRRLADALPDIITRFDRQLRHLFVNRAGLEVAQLPAEAMLGKTHEELGMPKVLCALWREEMEQVFATGEPTRVTFAYPPGPNGRHFEALISPESYANGEVQTILAATRDVTDRHEQQQALLASERRYRALVDALPRSVVMLLNEELRYLMLAGQGLLPEFPPARFLGKTPEDALPPQAAAVCREHLEKALRGEACRFELTLGGRVFESHCNLLSDPVTGERQLMVVGHDVTEERQGHRELQAVLEESQRRQQQLELAAEAANMWTWDLDLATGRIDYSDGLLHTLGRTRKEVGETAEQLEQFIPEEDRLHIKAKLAQFRTEMREGEGARWTAHHRYLRPSGEQRFIVAFGVAASRSEPKTGQRLVGIGMDITDPEKAAVQTSHARRLESLGIMAGGMAHDFNNLLVSILGYAELALLEISEQHPGFSHLHKVREASEQAAQLCNLLLAYSGKSPLRRNKLDLGGVVREMSATLKGRCSKGVRLELAVEKGLPPIEADPALLRQVLFALVENANEAINGDGTISIVVGGGAPCQPRPGSWCENEMAQGKRCVRLEVRDDGCGIAPDQLERIFEPFFSTKFTGRGLGLAAVSGIIKAHEGGLAVSSHPGKGTSFCICLPAAAEAPGESSSGEIELPRLGGRVLLLEDDEGSRDVAQAYLMRGGFEPVAANNPAHAQEILAAERGGLVAAVVDVTVASAAAKDLLEVLRREHANLPLITTSSYDLTGMSEESHRPIEAYLQKPYSLLDLLGALDRVLTRRRTLSP